MRIVLRVEEPAVPMQEQIPRRLTAQARLRTPRNDNFKGVLRHGRSRALPILHWLLEPTKGGLRYPGPCPFSRRRRPDLSLELIDGEEDFLDCLYSSRLVHVRAPALVGGCGDGPLHIPELVGGVQERLVLRSWPLRPKQLKVARTAREAALRAVVVAVVVSALLRCERESHPSSSSTP